MKMLQKILLNNDFLPVSMFDWSLGRFEEYFKTDQNDAHSSISSCDIGEDEIPNNEEI